MTCLPRNNWQLTLACRNTQQWTALRAQGVQTPQIAAWQRLPDLPAATYANSDPASSIYSYLLNVYNVAGFQDVRRSACSISRDTVRHPAYLGCPARVRTT